MNRVRHRRNYDLHSWTGVTLGLFVFVVSFSGCIALFDQELKTWEDPAKRETMPQHPVAIGEQFSHWAAETAQGDAVERARFDFPTPLTPYYYARVEVHRSDDRHVTEEVRWSARTGDPLPARGEGLTTWLLDFHRDLMWPAELGGRTIGRSVVGVAGVIVLLSILTGLIAHTKILRDLFTLRYYRSVRLKWQDTHKLMGVWLTPFFAMIAYTGAFLGIVALLTPIVALLAFKGDQQALVNAVLGPPAEPAGIHAPMVSMDTIAQIPHPDSGRLPARVLMTHWGDQNATMDVLYTSEDKLVAFETLSVSAITAEPVHTPPIEAVTPAQRVVDSMSPLHYGTFGGIALKWLYFVLGLMLCVVTVTGLMMWIERRLHGREGTLNPVIYRRMSRAVVGLTLGLPMATLALFYLDKLYVGEEDARLMWTGGAYFSVWLLTALGACVARTDYQAVRWLVRGMGVGLVALPLLNLFTTGDAFWSGLTVGASWAWADVAFLVLGLLSLYVAHVLPQRRPVRTAPEPRTETSTTLEASLGGAS